MPISVDQLNENGAAQLTKCFICFTHILCLLIQSQECVAEAWIFEPSIQLGAGYDDNVRLLNDLQDGASYSALSVSAVAKRITETNQFRIRYEGESTKYVDPEREDLDDTDFQKLDIGGRFNISALNVLSLNAGILRTHTDRTQYTEEENGEVTEGELVDADLDTDIGVTRLQIRRETLRANGDWVHSLSEVSDVGLYFRSSKINYDREVELVGLYEYEYHNSGLKYQRNWYGNNRTFVVLDGAYYESLEVGKKNEEYGISFGTNYSLSEKANIGLSVGWRNLSEKNEEPYSDDQSIVFRLHSKNQSELIEVRGSIERKMSPSITGRVFLNDVLKFNLYRKLTDRHRLILSARLFRNESINTLADDGADRKYAIFEPMLRYFIDKELSFDFSYRFRWQERANEEESAESHATLFSLTYRLGGDY